MKILFKNTDDKVLAEYDSFINYEELISTKEILEYENKSNIIVEISNLKDISQLVDGDCIVVAEFLGREKHFKGIFNEDKRIIFFAIPSTYKILGYIQ